MKSRLSTVRTGSWTCSVAQALSWLRPARATVPARPRPGARPAGPAVRRSGAGGWGAGGNGRGDRRMGTGGAAAPGVGGATGTTDSGVDVPAATDAEVDSGTPDIVVRDGSVTGRRRSHRMDGGRHADHVPTAQTNPPDHRAAGDQRRVRRDRPQHPLGDRSLPGHAHLPAVLHGEHAAGPALQPHHPVHNQDTGDYPVQMDVLVLLKPTERTTPRW